MNNQNTKNYAQAIANAVHNLMSYGLSQRDEIIVKLVNSGKVSQAEIARILGLSRQRLEQIIKRYNSKENSGLTE